MTQDSGQRNQFTKELGAYFSQNGLSPLVGRVMAEQLLSDHPGLSTSDLMELLEEQGFNQHIDVSCLESSSLNAFMSEDPDKRFIEKSQEFGRSLPTNATLLSPIWPILPHGA